MLFRSIDMFPSHDTQNEIDPAKPYNPQVQFTESFSWVEPLITYYKQDNEAKYYLVRALTANISMNNNDYSDWTQMQQAAGTLSWRPVNLNHNHNKFLPFPRTRVDFTRAEDLSVEATLRVDNADKWLQDMLDKKQILHPSIEGRATPDGNYQFTAMALLEAGVELPGDPLTEILPLMFNESVGKQICKMIDGKMVCNCQMEAKKQLNEENPEEKKTISELKKDKSTLELEVFNLKDEKTTWETERKTLNDNLTRQRLEATKKIEELQNKIIASDSIITEKTNRVTELDQKNEKLKQQLTDEIIEKQRSLDKLQKQITEATDSRDQYQQLSEKLKAAHEEDVAKNKRFMEESIGHNETITTLNEKVLTLENDKKRLIEKIQKAQKFQTWAYKELQKAGIVVTD